MVAGLATLVVAEDPDLGHDALGGHHPRQEIRGAHELGDERRGRAMVDGLRRPELFQPPRVQHADLVGDGEGFLLVVGHEDRRRFRGAEDLLHLVAHLRAQVGVEVRERLVEEQ